MKFDKGQLLSAAITGLMGAALASTPTASNAETKADPKGQCVGANACKGQSGCAVPGQHTCHTQNACKGKGWLEKSKSECDALAKKDKKITFKTMGS